MKHNSHIYVAYKAIDFLYESLENLHYESGNIASKKRRKDIREKGRDLERLLKFHKNRVLEASWAPDGILFDMAQYHTFKLFSKKDFKDAKKFGKEPHEKDDHTYYRAKGGGGLAFKIDHLSKIISDIIKLRNYNDNYSLEHIMYMFLLLSHYVVDAHVPMHCDIRDDVPSDKKPQDGVYYEKFKLHNKIEKEWEKACTYVGVQEEIPGMENADKIAIKNNLIEKVEFDVSNELHRNEIKTYIFKRKSLMRSVVNICIDSKNRSLILVKSKNPETYDKTIFPDMTREIFSAAIGNLISIWVCIWAGE
ncbi:MAG: hypothetical protein GY839_02665 [candidate division Zixibacteria bacterium]|nr:hypothetical protein [candidate division Zixibacteria bacterium]